MKSSNTDLQPKIHWFSAWQFALSGLALAILWTIALALAALGLSSLIGPATSASASLPLFMLAVASVSAGVLLLPSAGYALRRLLGRPASRPLRAPHSPLPVLLIFIFPMILLLGRWVGNFNSLSWLALPLLHVLAIGLPIFWLVYIAVRDLPLGSGQRLWGVLGSGLVLGPFLILILEGVAALVVFLIAVFAIASRPEAVNQIMQLSNWMSTANPTPDQLLAEIGPYLIKPAVIFSVLGFGSILVPMIEEALKPIGVWLLVGRRLSPAAGFAAGVVSGAGYALFESLAITADSATWASVVVARIGTAMVHILTTGLVGWALVQVWQKRRYLRLGLAYLAAVLLHGLWNGLTLMATFANLAQNQGSQTQIPWLLLGNIALFGLGFLAFFALLALFWINRALRPPLSQAGPASPPALPVDSLPVETVLPLPEASQPEAPAKPNQNLTE